MDEQQFELVEKWRAFQAEATLSLAGGIGEEKLTPLRALEVAHYATRAAIVEASMTEFSSQQEESRTEPINVAYHGLIGRLLSDETATKYDKVTDVMLALGSVGLRMPQFIRRRAILSRWELAKPALERPLDISEIENQT